MRGRHSLGHSLDLLDNLCDLAIKSDTGQHLQFLGCLFHVSLKISDATLQEGRSPTYTKTFFYTLDIIGTLELSEKAKSLGRINT